MDTRRVLSPLVSAMMGLPISEDALYLSTGSPAENPAWGWPAGAAGHPALDSAREATFGKFQRGNEWKMGGGAGMSCGRLFEKSLRSHTGSGSHAKQRSLGRESRGTPWDLLPKVAFCCSGEADEPRPRTAFSIASFQVSPVLGMRLFSSAP